MRAGCVVLDWVIKCRCTKYGTLNLICLLLIVISITFNWGNHSLCRVADLENILEQDEIDLKVLRSFCFNGTKRPLVTPRFLCGSELCNPIMLLLFRRHTGLQRISSAMLDAAARLSEPQKVNMASEAYEAARTVQTVCQ